MKPQGQAAVANGAGGLAAFQALETKVGAWVHIDDHAVTSGKPLFGVKDVIDVIDMPTCAGSRTRSHVAPATKDATIVRRLRARGYLPLGKTVTTEFAFVDPATTRNPYALTHSPGGSSSGSAAAVAAGMVPFALGTQTAGSLCRPAAYCGVVAIKPSYGSLPMDGLVPLSPTFDTPGVIARDVGTAADALAIMTERDELATGAFPNCVQLAFLPESVTPNLSATVRDFLRRTIQALREAGLSVENADFDPNYSHVVDNHRTVMLYEAYAAHGALLKTNVHLLQPRFREALAEASTVSQTDAAAARSRLADVRARVWDRLYPFDAIILPPAPSVAPRGFTTTGDQSYQTPWTAFHGPLVTVPGEFNADRLPLAMMLAGPPGSDRTTIAIAKAIQPIIDRLPAIAPL
jgi:Asp-tRNA(Asn)/Glu-tRNA(Gln) amidotransferase A subunit family amidase